MPATDDPDSSHNLVAKSSINDDTHTHDTEDYEMGSRTLLGDVCDTCRELDLVTVLKGTCASLGLAWKKRNRFGFGTLGRIEKHKSCSVCQLVLSCVLAYYDQTLPPIASEVTLLYLCTYARESDPVWNKSGRNQRPYSIPSLYVEVCTHRLENGNKKERDDVVGAVIPILPVDEEISAAPSTRERKPFSLPEPENQYWLSPREVKHHIDTNLVRDWFRHCLEHHGDTCGQFVSPSKLDVMIRLIDVEDMRLVKATLRTKYVALSYVWGVNTLPLLTKSTEQTLSRHGGISVELLPRTIGDAVELTRQIGQRFLWVDSACIIQDSEIDKQSHLPLMDSVYKIAEVVIVAANSENAHCGLKGASNPRKKAYRPAALIQGRGFTTILPGLLEHLNDSVWNSRGWTFQEGLLARRLLVCTGKQVYWNCQDAVFCEDKFTEFSNLDPKPTYSSSFFRNIPVRKCGSRAVTGIAPCHLQSYVDKVENFTSRQLTDQSDALWAFLGILKTLKPHFPRGYIWGIPWDALDAMLLWDVDCGFVHSSGFHTIPKRGKGYAKIKFPSWTWLAKGCNVHYDSCGQWAVSKVTWRDPIPYGNNYKVPHTCSKGNIHYSKPTLLGEPQHFKFEYIQATSSFGHLQFDAPTATLTVQVIEQLYLRPSDCKHEGSWSVLANILLPDGSCIGSIKCPCETFFSQHIRNYIQRGDKVEAEFIHLSTHRLTNGLIGFRAIQCGEVGDGDDEMKNTASHLPGCKSAANVNLMMVQWDDDHKVAFRVAITRVKEPDWEKVETHRQRIVLG